MMAVSARRHAHDPRPALQRREASPGWKRLNERGPVGYAADATILRPPEGAGQGHFGWAERGVAEHFEVPVEVIFSTSPFPRLGTATDSASA
jgi:hypothetical protein